MAEETLQACQPNAARTREQGMDDDLDLGGLTHLDDPAPPAFDGSGAAAAQAAARRSQARVLGGAGIGALLAVLVGVAVLSQTAGRDAPTLPLAAATSAPGGESSDALLPALDTTTIDPRQLVPTTGLPTTLPRPIATTIPSSSTTGVTRPGSSTTSTAGPARGAPPTGDQAPPDGVTFTIVVRNTTLRWDESQRVTARLVNNSRQDLHILAGCGVTRASVYDLSGAEANTYGSGAPQCNDQTGYFSPAVVHPGETREAVVTLVAQGPGNPEAAPGAKGVTPGRYNAYGSWALDSGGAGRIDYMHSEPVAVEVVGK
jgi:hypothetical protein